ncbi:hypothetical protein AMTRI_Chr11g100130 [Amborella trichopoda]
MECGGVGEEEEKKSIVAGDATFLSLLRWQPHHQNAVCLSSPINYLQGLDLRGMCKAEGTGRTRTHECPHARRARITRPHEQEPARTEIPHQCPHIQRARTSALTPAEPPRVPTRPERAPQSPPAPSARTSARMHGELVPRTRTYGELARVPSRRESSLECPHTWRAHMSAITNGEPARVPSRA